MNLKHLFKYLIMLIVITVSTFYIPNCSIINEHAIYIGLLAATTFVLLDKYVPTVIIIKDEHEI
tara:strand:- start:374 stop:565 length:192 start_codon:yes stop_codon:yes gene_type:complete